MFLVYTGRNDRYRRGAHLGTAAPFTVLNVVLDSGERLPCLVESATWLPVRVATRWAVRHRRYRACEHLAVAETHPPEEARLDVRSVAAALGVSPTTLYKYGLNGEINAAERRQHKNGLLSGAVIEQRYFQDQITQLKAELEKEREISKGLVGRIAIMEANAARLGFDPEEIYKPILKPARTMSRAGTNRSGAGRPFRRG